jgi:hypothetical protein
MTPDQKISALLEVNQNLATAMQTMQGQMLRLTAVISELEKRHVFLAARVGRMEVEACWRR